MLHGSRTQMKKYVSVWCFKVYYKWVLKGIFVNSSQVRDEGLLRRRRPSAPSFDFLPSTTHKQLSHQNSDSSLSSTGTQWDTSPNQHLTQNRCLPRIPGMKPSQRSPAPRTGQPPSARWRAVNSPGVPRLDGLWKATWKTERHKRPSSVRTQVWTVH